jgi:hypothetical protein
MIRTTDRHRLENAPQIKKYTKPEFKLAGTLSDLTQGFAGSVPDEQGGQTKRNPYQG